MKIKCDFCGFKYYESEYGNKCPSCGKSHKIVEAYDVRALDGEDKKRNTLAKTPGDEEDYSIYTADKPTQLINALYYLACFLVTALIIFLDVSFLGYKIDENKKNQKYNEDKAVIEQNIETEIPIEDYNYGELIHLQKLSGKTIEIDITSVKKMTEGIVPMPEGYEMVEIRYTINDEEMSEYSTYLDNAYIDVYAGTKSGQYVKPIDYGYEDVIDLKGQSSYALGINSQMCYKEGIIYIILQENDLDHFALYYYTGNYYSSRDLCEIVMVNNVEVTR